MRRNNPLRFRVCGQPDHRPETAPSKKSLKDMVLPVGIEPTTSPLPRAGISRKRAEMLALAAAGGRNVPRIDGRSGDTPGT